MPGNVARRRYAVALACCPAALRGEHVQGHARPPKKQFEGGLVGFSHQEAPQEDVEEEAPQAAAQDASSAQEQEVAGCRGPAEAGPGDLITAGQGGERPVTTNQPDSPDGPVFSARPDGGGGPASPGGRPGAHVGSVPSGGGPASPGGWRPRLGAAGGVARGGPWGG